jgi:hypothetical protein
VQVARGYLNRPELTAERFVADRFGGAADARLYRSGDLARYLPDGRIEFLGRSDFQVKIRGYRIELGEIENVLLGLDGVREAAVLARQDSAGDKRLVAYVAVRDSVEIAALREELRACLPDHMLPSAFVRVAALPLTANGKLDQKALPAPEAGAMQAAYVAPVSATEHLLCRICQDLLGLQRIGVGDNFFQLGGHSLLAMRLIAEIHSAMGIKVPVRVLFERDTIAHLAQYLDTCDANPPPVTIGRRHESAGAPAQLDEIEL